MSISHILIAIEKSGTKIKKTNAHLNFDLKWVNVTLLLHFFENHPYASFFTKIFCKTGTLLVGRSWECRELVAAKLWQIYNAKFLRRLMNVVRVWYEVRATVLRKKCEHLATIWRENKTKQHSFQCHATVIRMKMKISYIRGKVGRHSHECLVTVVRQSRDIFSKLD